MHKLWCLLICAIPAWPAVVDSAGNGFTVRTTLEIHAPPDQVYKQLLNIGSWWNSEHTFSGDAHNLSLEEKPMGCFCEKLPGQGAVRHMEVVNFAPGKSMVLTGALGPLQSLAVTGSMTVVLAPVANTNDAKTDTKNGNTKLQVTYAVTGYLAGGLQIWAAPVDSVVSQQFTRLKSYVEQNQTVQK